MNTQKGFAPILLILLGLIVIGGGVYFYTQNNQKKISEQEVVKENTIEAPENVLKDYYTNIINHLNQKTEKDISLGSGLVTNKVVNSFNELKTEYPDGIPFNPFICAQDFPDDSSKLVFKQISINNTNAKFEVFVFQKPITVSLVKDKSWKIDEINCNR